MIPSTQRVETDAQIVSGECDDGMPFVPGVNCVDCGKFVGRDGHIAIEHFEMSFEVASVDGMCASCLHGEGEGTRP